MPYVYDLDHCVASTFNWRFTNLSLQQRLGLLPEWWTWLGTLNFGRVDACRSGVKHTSALARRVLSLIGLRINFGWHSANRVMEITYILLSLFLAVYKREIFYATASGFFSSYHF